MSNVVLSGRNVAFPVVSARRETPRFEILAHLARSLSCHMNNLASGITMYYYTTIGIWLICAYTIAAKRYNITYLYCYGRWSLPRGQRIISYSLYRGDPILSIASCTRAAQAQPGGNAKLSMHPMAIGWLSYYARANRYNYSAYSARRRADTSWPAVVRVCCSHQSSVSIHSRFTLDRLSLSAADSRHRPSSTDSRVSLSRLSVNAITQENAIRYFLSARFITNFRLRLIN